MSLFTTDDLDEFKTDRLLGLTQSYLAGMELSDSYLMGQIKAAEADIGRQLKVFLEPTTIFPYEPSAGEITALSGGPWVEEPGYDYDPSFFSGEAWGYLLLRQRPLIKINFVRFAYPNVDQPFWVVPPDWLRPDKQYGHLRFVPASSTTGFPLNTFVMAAMGAGRTIPSMIQVGYQAGLQDARNKWPDLVDVIFKSASLKIVEANLPAGSASIAADGLSQSVSLKLEDYRDMIDRALFGPKGSNGGLFSAIHGVVGQIAGLVA